MESRSESVFTNHYQDKSPRFCIFDCNTTSDWLNRMVYAAKYGKIWIDLLYWALMPFFNS